MSVISFDRKAVVKVFGTESVKNADGSLSLSQIDQEGKAYASKMADGSPGFRVKFSVDKITEPTPHATSIFIYNLSGDSRSRFENRNNIVVLEAGYQDAVEVIYRGNVVRTRTRKEGPDYVTEVECADGLFAYQYARIDQSFRPGARKNQVINTLAGALANAGVGIGTIQGVKDDGYNQGLVLSGRVTDLLRDVCQKDNLQFTILDGQVTIVPLNQSTQDAAVLISPDTGMIGIPEIGEGGRITVKCLMNPKIKPFGKIAVVSKFLMDFKENKSLARSSPDAETKPGSGIYTAVKVVHSGDTWGGEWFTTVEAV
jgi:hypothetical protein